MKLNKEDRVRYLRQLAKSTEGKALKEYLQEKIDIMRDARTFDPDDFEFDGRVKMNAADLVETFLKDLSRLSYEKGKKQVNPYQ